MDMITLAMAKAYTDSQSLVSVENTIRTCAENITINAGVPFLTLVTPGSYNFHFIPGRKYVVSINGKKFAEETCKVLEPGVCYIGNLSFVSSSEENTGEMYLIRELTSQSGSGGFDDKFLWIHANDPTTGDKSVTRVVAIEAVEEIITPIEPKYFPTVAITSAEYQSSVNVALSAEESAQLDSVVGAPAIIKVGYGGAQIANWAQYFLGVDGKHRFVLPFQGIRLKFYQGETGWMMGNEPETGV